MGQKRGFKLVKKFISEQLENVDTPLGLSRFKIFSWLFKQGKVRVYIINEDNSYKEYFKKFPKSYCFVIKKRAYLFLSRCLLKGKYPTITYYYNNPYPIEFKYEISQLTALDLRTSEQQNKLSDEQKSIYVNTPMDSETLNLAFTSKVMGAIYGQSGFTTKHLIIILVVVAVIVLVFLQVFGVVDVMGMISGAGK